MAAVQAMAVVEVSGARVLAEGADPTLAVVAEVAPTVAVVAEVVVGITTRSGRQPKD